MIINYRWMDGWIFQNNQAVISSKQKFLGYVMFLISTLTGQFIWNVNFNQEFNLKISGCRNKLKLSIWIHSPPMLNWEIRLCYIWPKISGKKSDFGIFGKNSWYELPLTAGKLWNLADKRSVFSTCVTSQGFWTKIFEFWTFLDISKSKDQNQLYHTPLLRFKR